MGVSVQIEIEMGAGRADGYFEIGGRWPLKSKEDVQSNRLPHYITNF